MKTSRVLSSTNQFCQIHMLQMAGNGIVLEIWTIQKLDGTSGLQYIFTRQVLEAKENKK